VRAVSRDTWWRPWLHGRNWQDWLARDFAAEHQDAYHAVWWIDAERRDASRTNMLADIAALGAKLSEHIKTEAQTNVEEAARETLRMIAAAGYARPFLLVYDNVNRPEDIECWTPRLGAHILLTTRYAEWDDMVAKVEVGALARETAIDVLLKRGKNRRSTRPPADWRTRSIACLWPSIMLPPTVRSRHGPPSRSISASSLLGSTMSRRAPRAATAAACARHSRLPCGVSSTAMLRSLSNRAPRHRRSWASQRYLRRCAAALGGGLLRYIFSTLRRNARSSSRYRAARNIPLRADRAHGQRSRIENDNLLGDNSLPMGTPWRKALASIQSFVGGRYEYQ
jgi:hypothetical protein